MEAIIDNPYILLTDKKISNIQEILPLLENLMQQSGKLVIVCDDIESEALSTLKYECHHLISKLFSFCYFFNYLKTNPFLGHQSSKSR